MIEQIKIMDIPFSSFTETEILELIKKQFSYSKKEKLFLATPNPEILLSTIKYNKLKKILQRECLNIPDGNGIIWANYFLQKTNKINCKSKIILWGILSLLIFPFKKKNTNKRFSKAIHGSDLTMKICMDKILCKHGVFLLGNKNGLISNTAELASKKLKTLNKNLTLSGYIDFPTKLYCPLLYEKTSKIKSKFQKENEKIIQKINHSKAKILFVAFGSPNQELWISENLHKLTNIKFAVGVGGTFDFIAGIVPRAPLFLRKTGFEWLYRLYKQPRKRIKRIFNALIIFPITIIKHKLLIQRISNNKKIV